MPPPAMPDRRPRRNLAALALALAFAATTAMPVADAGEVREWTDTRGRTLRAEFLGAEDGTVRVRRVRDDRVFRIAIDRLSEKDRAFVRDRRDEASPEAAKESSPTPPEWPRRVEAPRDFEVEIVRKDRDRQTFVYRTPHFEVRSNVELVRSLVREASRIFEATFLAVEALPIELRPQPPGDDAYYEAQIFETVEQYHAAGAIQGSAGVYRSRDEKILMPIQSLGVKKQSSGYGIDDDKSRDILVHELTHQLMGAWNRKVPIWVSEGLAEFMERVPYVSETFRFDRMDLPDALRGRGDEQRVMPLERLIHLTNSEWRANFQKRPDDVTAYYQSAFLLAYYFLRLDGEGNAERFHAYFRAIENGAPPEQALEKLLDDRDFEALAEDFRRALNRENVDVTFDDSL